MKLTDDKLMMLKRRKDELRRQEQELVVDVMDKRAETAAQLKELDELLEDLRPERAEENGVIREHGGAISPMPH